MQRLCNKGLRNARLGEGVNKPIWNAPSFPSTPPSRRLFASQGPLHAVFPRFQRRLACLPLHSSLSTPTVVSSVPRGGWPEPVGGHAPVPCTSDLTVPGTSPYTARGLCHCPREWGRRAATP